MPPPRRLLGRLARVLNALRYERCHASDRYLS
jgi:hypothetical protein